MVKDTWDPSRYELFAAQRAEPFWDLVAMCEQTSEPRVLDLGCGTGELTRELHLAVHASHTLGIDSSPAMLARAHPLADERLTFEQADVRDLDLGERFDVVFSNAALQWLPDHEHLFGRLRELLAPGGQLVVQMPDNLRMITHTTAAEVAQEQQFAAHLVGGERRGEILSSERYALLLYELGFVDQHVSRRIYGHLLDSREDLITWLEGSLLTEYRRLLPPEIYERFLTRYRQTLLPRLSDRHPYFLAFPRILLYGRLPVDG